MITPIDLKVTLAELKNIAFDQLKTCRIPVGIYLHEADRLYTRLLLDVSQLTQAGMLELMATELWHRKELLRNAELVWQEHANQRQAAMQGWKTAAQEMHAFYTDLLHQMTFAYREDEELLMRLSTLKRKQSHAQVIQGLSNLYVLGKARQEPLTAIGFDMGRLDQAAAMADRLAGVYATANVYRRCENDEKVTRDKAFTLLKEVVDEVRHYGRFVFRNQPGKARAYASQYRREQKLRQQ